MILEFQQRQKLYSDTEARIAVLEERKRLVEAQQQIGTVQLDSVILVDYVKSDTPPQIDLSAISVRASRMLVYDRNQVCVGLVEDNRFKFWKYYKGVCPW